MRPRPRHGQFSTGAQSCPILPPPLRRTADRVYETSDPDALRALLNTLFTHQRVAPGGLASDRWIYDGRGGRTILTLFIRDGHGRLTLLGPRLDEVEQLTEAEVQR